ncbi:DUF2283 domain-containing protein [Candidatus Micrarchaeota archaeon]|nr:DUF2283 domain-containing protein [Candidatus Micrarchaeota archaeon]
MINLINYDAEADALYVGLSSKKAYFSIELSPRIIVDLTQSNKAIGVELLDASKLISELFGFKVGREDLNNLDCQVDDKDELLLRFELNKKHQSLLIPKAYASPILSAKE